MQVQSSAHGLVCGLVAVLLLACAMCGADSTIGQDATLRAAWLEKHNTLRASYGLAPLVWDTAAADVAQGYISTCPGLVHNAARGNYGENLCVSSVAEDEGCVDRWNNELADWTCETDACAAGAVCGHVTQVLWQDTTGVGCAVENCPAHTWRGQAVCNYSPPGNFNNQRPFPVDQCSFVATPPGGTSTSPTGTGSTQLTGPSPTGAAPSSPSSLSDSERAAAIAVPVVVGGLLIAGAVVGGAIVVLRRRKRAAHDRDAKASASGVSGKSSRSSSSAASQSSSSSALSISAAV